MSAFLWTPKQQKAFDTLKDSLYSSPVLVLPDVRLPFEVETDASQYAMGAVLKQGGRPVAYHSESFTTSKANYSTYDKELYALI